MEHRGDIADQAADQEEAFRVMALKTITKANGPEFHPDFDGEHCISCGNQIEEGRLKLQKIKCVECQAAMEKLNKMRGA